MARQGTLYSRRPSVPASNNSADREHGCDSDAQLVIALTRGSLARVDGSGVDAFGVEGVTAGGTAATELLAAVEILRERHRCWEGVG
jgi:hypothetical protein